jgi:hypothetical protein
LGPGTDRTVVRPRSDSDSDEWVLAAEMRTNRPPCAPFGSWRHDDARCRMASGMPNPDRRGERRRLPRYHPSCAPPARARGARLSVVASVGTTHLSLLAARCDVLRPAAPGRVRGDSASPRLPPSLGRFCGSRPYSSPSLRGIAGWNPPTRRSRRGYAIVRGRALTVPLPGGRQRVGRARRAGRPSGEREIPSHSRRLARVIGQPP